jgi:nucleotide-binding universal stress UspA family protein
LSNSESRYKRVVVAVDGSKFGDKALSDAIELCRLSGAKLMIVNVVQEFPSMYMSVAEGMVPQPAIDDYYKAARRFSDHLLKRSLKKAQESGVVAETSSLDAPSPGEAIVEYAEKQGVDLVVVGTRGLTGLKRVLLGSVSRAVVEHAHCNVMVSR